MSKPKHGTQVPVSERAVLQRLNRALAKRGAVIRVSKEGTRAFQDLGRYYEVDTSRNALETPDVDIESYAREEGVLKPFEAMVEA